MPKAKTKAKPKLADRIIPSGHYWSVAEADVEQTREGLRGADLGQIARAGYIPARYTSPRNGRLVLSIVGMLVNKTCSLAIASGWTILDQLDSLLDYAERDRGVEQIIIEVASGGGEYDGVVPFAQRIAAMPNVTALVDGWAIGAAAVIAMAAPRVVATRVSWIGRTRVHIMDPGWSLPSTPAGADPFELERIVPDGPAVAQRLTGQATALVADWRDLPADDEVRNTLADRALIGEQAVRCGLIDEIVTAEQACAMLGVAN